MHRTGCRSRDAWPTDRAAVGRIGVTGGSGINGSVIVASIGPGGDRIAAFTVAIAAAGATGVDVRALARQRSTDRLLLSWVVLTGASAALWFSVGLAPSSSVVPLVAVATSSFGLYLVAGAAVWSRYRGWSLATTRVLVDVAAVAAGASGLWVLARVPTRLADGSLVADRPALIAVGVMAMPPLAYAVVGGSRNETGLLRVAGALAGGGALLWADDRLRDGQVPVLAGAVLALAVLVNAVAFGVAVRQRSADRSSRGSPNPAPTLTREPAVDVDVTAIEPSPMIAGVAEALLWLLIIAFQLHHEIELSVAIAACIAATAISARSMSRWLDQTRVVRSLQQMANTDPLTGLPNRRGFARAMSGCRPGALALIDLDGFKAVNDRLGHATGDQLLGAVADAGRRHLPAGATLARLGGDEFGLVVPGSADDGVRVAEEVVAAIAGLRLAGHVTASAGVAEISPDGEATLRNAGFALHWAKRAGRGRTIKLSEQMVHLELRRSELAEDLAADIERGRLHVAYQPIMRIADRGVVSAEALARWDHPVHGEVSAEEFIPIAEERGLIDRVGELVLDRVVADIAAWERHGIVVDVAVNVSGRQLRGADTVRRYAERVVDAGVRGRVSIEVTESEIVDDESLDTLEALRAHGFRIAIDDFGTGYASISRFMRMRPDRLKIDRRFVRDLGTPAGAASAVLVEAVVGIAHQFGVEVVAEGVETEAAMAVLAGVGCDYVQGYLLGRPGPVADLVRMVAHCGPSRTS